MNSQNVKVYFPGLNGLRFIAASSVVITHLEQYKNYSKLPSFYYRFPFIQTLGDIAVTLFFVLSGFLVTYLLITEKKIIGTISIKNFYRRRIYRIWPLYYFIVILGFFIMPLFNVILNPRLTSMLYIQFIPKLLFFVFMIPNFLNIEGAPYINGPLWSIGVEEQFYLIWPVIIKNSNNYLKAILTVILVYLALRAGCVVAKKLPMNFINLHFLDTVAKLLLVTRIDCMAIGALGSFILYFNIKYLLAILYNKFSQIIIYSITFMVVFFKLRFYFFNHEVISILFCIIILNVASNKKSIFKLENKFLNFLGKISYGIYMYHCLVLVFVVYFFKSYMATGSIFWQIFIDVIVLVLTVLISGISYKYFETKILNFKRKHAVIISGDSAHDE